MPPTTYRANCHCGLIKYTVTLPDAVSPTGSSKITKCNCSICTKNGYLLLYPKRTDVTFLPHCESKLKSYTFGSGNVTHRFCPSCSSSVLIDFQNAPFESMKPHLGVNARLFQDLDLEKAEYTLVDGKNKLKPDYSVSWD